MTVLVTCKNEEDSIKNVGLECSQHYTSFSDSQGQIGGIWPKFKLIQAIMHVTCKNEDD